MNIYIWGDIYIYMHLPFQLALDDSKLPVIWPTTLSSTYLTARSLTPGRMAQEKSFHFSQESKGTHARVHGWINPDFYFPSQATQIQP